MQSLLKAVFLTVPLAVGIGCGGGASPDFSLAVAPTSVSATAGGPAQELAITASSLNGFKGTVKVSVGTLPSGVTVSPSTISLAPGALEDVTITVASSVAAGNMSIALQGSSGSLTHQATATVVVASPVPSSTTASLSTSSFNFGDNLVNNTLTQSVVTVTNTGADVLSLNPTLSGDPSYSLAAGGSCGATLAAGASCGMVVNYTPTVSSTPGTQNTVLNMGFLDVPAGTPQTVMISGISAALPVGVVTTTHNPQVALYTMTLPFPGSVTINFGTDTNYGLSTWTQSTETSGGQVSIFVAGMKGSTLYHMQAAVQFANGITAHDTDHTFTTQPVPANMQPQLTVATTPGMTPQPGVELLNPVNGNPQGVMVADLLGNVLWTYAVPGTTTGVLSDQIDGVKLLPNGDFLMVVGDLSNGPLQGPPVPGAVVEIREVNLAGDLVREISVDDLNSELASAGCTECNITLNDFHHDVTVLPNGHWLVIANSIELLSTTTTPALTNAPPEFVLGDAIIDLDTNLQPVWVWNSFNHLDPNRHPYSFPDWTHANAVLYSKDDGDIIFSMRHQNWVIKIDYEDGKGTGNIVWHLGEGGDFTVKGGTDPTDWMYAQHYPSYFTSNTAGVFSLGLMDNGDDRIFPAGVTCGATGAPPCLYTTIPVYQLDESAKTATLTFHQILPTTLYSYFGGNTELLANGDIEYDLCALPTLGSEVFEVTPQATPQTVWTMKVSGINFYRAFRIPSMYPGVQW